MQPLLHENLVETYRVDFRRSIEFLDLTRYRCTRMHHLAEPSNRAPQIIMPEGFTY